MKQATQFLQLFNHLISSHLLAPLGEQALKIVGLYGMPALVLIIIARCHLIIPLTVHHSRDRAHNVAPAQKAVASFLAASSTIHMWASIDPACQENQYDKALTFVAVDWDGYRDHDVTTSRNIPRRSTLLVLKGDQELGRIVAGTSTKEIKALLDKGL